MKILVIQQKMIGDVLTSSILFEALRQKYPSAQLDYLINEHTFPVVQNNPFIDNYVFYTKKEDESKRALLKLALKVRRNNYDVVIDVYSKLTSFLICSFSKAKTKISYYKSYSTFLYHHNVKRLEQHSSTDNLAIHHRLDLLKPLDIKADNISPKIYLTKEELLKGKNYLLNQNIDLLRPLFMISVLGSSKNKTYPFEYMASVIDIVASEEPDCQILFNYLPKQKEEAFAIYNLCNPNTKKNILMNVFGNSLREFLGIIQHCTALIGNEGGAANMAKALHVKTFSIFSPWIDKATWNLFENKNNVSVHLRDYKPEIYTEPEKTYKEESLNLYKKFKPAFFKDKLVDFLKNTSIGKVTQKGISNLDKNETLLSKTNSRQTAKISALIITFNEVKHIEKVINDLSFADEIIAVDSFSTDGTLEKLKQFDHVETICRPFKNFADQRNFAIEKAKNEWIVFIDADERIPKDLRSEIISEINDSTDYDAFLVKRLYYFKDKRIRFSGFQTDATYRVYKKESVKYIEERIVHEIPKISGKSKLLKSTMPHYCFESYDHYKSKMEHYAKLKAIELLDEGTKPNPFHFIFRPSYKFLLNYIFRLGILDGKEGFIICKLSAYGVYYRYVELKRLINKN
ncbi:glycosyltransferase [uncultured Algibacter sp.]|uniref:glycosyltransferase n=1 Tax=uncultured Algibacter sp. TaxID=298659 RepID=UPI002619C4DF|nr:glycosyltransferase [uncultured Algibacter sp.]